MMTTADWAILIPSIVAFLTAGAAYLRARTAHKAVNALANAKANAKEAKNDPDNG
jgi:hypothetical protein